MAGEIRAGILGAGGMGRSHGEVLHETEGVSVVAVCDNCHENAQILSDDLGAKCYNSFNRMLEKEKLDILYICLPPFAHNGQFEAAAVTHATPFTRHGGWINIKQAGK